MKKTEVKILWEDKWQIEENLILKKGKVYVLKKWEVESKDNLVTLWYTSSWTWREIKDNKIGNKKLLIARSNKIYRKIYK